MSTFALDLKKFAEKTAEKADMAVGGVVVRVVKEIDDRSPVGSSLRWKNPAPKGYVGGRFRGNWQLGVDSVPMGALDRIDPSGEGTVAAAVGGIPEKAAGHVFSYVNNLPYAQRIEQGWSSVAPSGVVGLTTIGWQTKVNQIVAELPS